jgi:hypothetical protein
MESVEQTTQSIPAQKADDSTDTMVASRADRTKAALPTSNGDPLAGLVQTGLAFLQNLAAVARGADGKASPLVGRDARTGEQYLKLPMPDPQKLQQMMELLNGLLAK